MALPSGIGDSGMIQDIVKIEFRSAVVQPPGAIGTLPLLSLPASKIPPEVHRELRETDILNCGGVYGQMGTGTPFQYDQLKIHLTYDTLEITVLSRAEVLKNAPDGKLLRIDRFMGVLKKLLKLKRKDAP